MKEDIIPNHVDKVMYVLAPIIILVPALITFAVIPFGERIELFGYTIKLQIADLNVGILWIFAIASLGVYGIAIGGWASNNKYSLLGGLRSSAQMISYEISMGLSVIGILLITGSLRLTDVVYTQMQPLPFLSFLPAWNVFTQPIAFIIFLTASYAETNRLPFDLPEAEQELVAGYHTEYSSMKFICFYMAEYCNMITSSALLVTLFFGGWHVPGLDWLVANLGISSFVESLIQVMGFAFKVGFFLFLYVLVRWTLPRFRYDQLMGIGWKVFIPLSLLSIIITAFVVAL
jgi:NADH-quinone oxidoreductase subunit H